MTAWPTHPALALEIVKKVNRGTKTLNTPVGQICIDCSHFQVPATPQYSSYLPLFQPLPQLYTPLPTPPSAIYPSSNPSLSYLPLFQPLPQLSTPLPTPPSAIYPSSNPSLSYLPLFQPLPQLSTPLPTPPSAIYPSSNPSLSYLPLFQPLPQLSTQKRSIVEIRFMTVKMLV